MRNRRKAALKAWRTMRGPVWKAHRTARLSKVALERWADKAGFKIIFFASPRGYPRTGIVDAVLLRIAPKFPDRIEIYLLQLKGGRSG